jgi:hypothetical protein
VLGQSWTSFWCVARQVEIEAEVYSGAPSMQKALMEELLGIMLAAAHCIIAEELTGTILGPHTSEFLNPSSVHLVCGQWGDDVHFCGCEMNASESERTESAIQLIRLCKYALIPAVESLHMLSSMPEITCKV